MNVRRLAAATTLIAVLSSCGGTHIRSEPQIPLTEPPARINTIVCVECAPRAIFQKLKRLIEKSDIVLVGETHTWVGHYGELAANMDELAKLGVKKIFIELPVSYNKLIGRYQRLRKESLDPEITEKNRARITREIAEVIKEFAADLSYFRDPAKLGYLLALLDRATVSSISVIAVDTIDNRTIPERDVHMAAQILFHLKTGEKALWLGGESHPEGMSPILDRHLRVSVFYVVSEILGQ